MTHSKLPRNVKPRPSHAPADKMVAALNWPIGRSKNGSSYERAPLYFDACWDWYQHLTEEQQDWLAYVVDALTSWGEEAGKRYAARLPPAPRCPL